MKKLLISVAAVVTVGALVLTGCPEDGGGGGGTTDYPYVCENGTAADGNSAAAGVSNCQECKTGFTAFGTLGEEGSTCAYEYVCENGNKNTGPAGARNTSNCDSCMSGFGIVGTAGNPGSTCAFIAYTCENGTATTGNGATPGLSSCDSCMPGFGIIGTAGQPGSMCGSIAYTCENGTATAGNGATPGLSSCDSCNTHYRISGTAGMAGSTCSANTCFRVYGDATRANCDQLSVPIAGGFSPRVGGSGGSNADLTFDEITTGGADGSANFRRLDFTGSTVHGARESFAEAAIFMTGNYDVTGKTLKFSIKSPTGVNGGNNTIRVFYQAGAASNNRTAEDSGIVMFTNNDTWQTVEIPTTDFDFMNPPPGGSAISPTAIRSIGFSILDANGLSPSGLGDQVIDIDEVRFEDTN